MINEDFLYYIWQHRLLQSHLLKLITGEEIEILHPGHRNFESGPDFFNARLRIGGIVWAGNVEIHTKASDWYRHHHTGDLSYDNIILHAVEISDTEILRLDGSAMPTLVMQGKYPAHYLEHYYNLMQGASPFVSCSRQLPEVPLLDRSLVIDRLLKIGRASCRERV